MTKILAAIFTIGAAVAADGPKAFTGTITDSMCGMNHKMMNIRPDAKCARECVKKSKDVKYVLHDGKKAYKLSDQQTPAEFAGQKVKVTGTLFAKTGVLKVDKMQGTK
ncbi:MAG TPA: hypothetical protein VMZ52_07855 [Bryobacteraceae bacterium]|nr:hypothetical protein [Bryobacteraceae bacterium]